MEPLQLAIICAVAFGVTVLSTPLVGRLALRVGAVDRPNERKVSVRENMPLLGGLAVAAGFAAALAVAKLSAVGLADAKLRGLLLGGGVILALGIVDDRFGLGARSKLSFQVLAALLVIAHGFEIFRFTDPLSGAAIELPRWLVWVTTTFWIVAVTNALNLLDGLDGLASGVAAIVAATLSVLAWQAGQPLALCIGIALAGALLGFLQHNFSPARIFLGDTGSLLVGFLLALLAIETYRRVSLITLLVPLMTLAVPLMDTTLSVLRRLRKRAPIFSADRQHMHHRLLDVAGSARSAVLQFYFLTGAFCLLAVSFSKLEGVVAAVFLAAVVILTIRLLWNLGVLSFDDESQESGHPGPGAVEEVER
jgi:UDP-GlcNAc:undecaprenyl-phosphate GlcNAc-1-phosphate transferase